MRAVLFITALWLAPVAALAQDASAQTEAELRRQAAEAREAAELRVERDMVEMTSLVEALSKTLGQIHWLRTLCFGQNDQTWREHMADMLSVEGGDDPKKRERMIRAFNAGYYAEQSRHSQCTQRVSTDVAALAENGRNLSNMLADPYRIIDAQQEANR